MIETAEEKLARLRKEAGAREERARRYAEKMGGTEPPVFPQTLTEVNRPNVLRNQKESADRVTLQPKSRADYMRQYRKKPKLCPHCGKDVNQKSVSTSA